MPLTVHEAVPGIASPTDSPLEPPLEHEPRTHALKHSDPSFPPTRTTQAPLAPRNAHPGTGGADAPCLASPDHQTWSIALGLLEGCYAGRFTDDANMNDLEALGGFQALTVACGPIRARLSAASTGGIVDRVRFPVPTTLNAVSLKALADAAWTDESLQRIGEPVRNSVRTIVESLTRRCGTDAVRFGNESTDRREPHYQVERVIAENLNGVRMAYPEEYAALTSRGLASWVLGDPILDAEEALEHDQTAAPLPTLVGAMGMVRKHVKDLEGITARDQVTLIRAMDLALRSGVRAQPKHALLRLPMARDQARASAPGPRFLEICRRAPVPDKLSEARERLMEAMEQGLQAVSWAPNPPPAKIGSAVLQALDSVSPGPDAAEEGGPLGSEALVALRAVWAPPHRQALELALTVTLAVAQLSAESGLPGMSFVALAAKGAAYIRQMAWTETPHTTFLNVPPEIDDAIAAMMDVPTLLTRFSTQPHAAARKVALGLGLSDAAWMNAFRATPEAANALMRQVTDAHLPIGQRAVDLATSPDELMAALPACRISARLLAWAPVELEARRGGGPSAEALLEHALAWLSRLAAMPAPGHELTHAGAQMALSITTAARGLGALSAHIRKQSTMLIQHHLDGFVDMFPQRAALYLNGVDFACQPDVHQEDRKALTRLVEGWLARASAPEPASLFTRACAGYLRLLVDFEVYSPPVVQDEATTQNDSSQFVTQNKLAEMVQRIDMWLAAGALESREFPALISLLTKAAQDDEIAPTTGAALEGLLDRLASALRRWQDADRSSS